MREWPRYLLATAAIGVAGAGLGGVLLPGLGGTALAVPALLAWLAQAGSSGVKIRLADRPDRWMAGWMWGAGFRIAALGVATWMVAGPREMAALPTLIGLVAFLFLMMLLEPLVLDLAPASPNEST